MPALPSVISSGWNSRSLPSTEAERYSDGYIPHTMGYPLPCSPRPYLADCPDTHFKKASHFASACVDIRRQSEQSDERCRISSKAPNSRNKGTSVVGRERSGLLLIICSKAKPPQTTQSWTGLEASKLAFWESSWRLGKRSKADSIRFIEKRPQDELRSRR